MRSFLIAALMAGAAATPAFAQDQNDPHAHWRHGQQQQSNGGGGHQQQQAPRAEGHPQRFDGAGFNRPQAPQPPQQYHQPPVIIQQGNHGFDRPHWTTPPQQPVPPQQANGYPAYPGHFAGQMPPQQVQVHNQDWNGRNRDDNRRGNWNNNSNSQNRYYNQQVVIQQQYGQGSRWANGGWNRDWRNDRQYDWRRWRDEHRSIFHVGIYYDPFGYGYQPFEIGFRLTPAYFGQQYWINDPWDYQLPPPPPGAMWVRYWNDALLVDLYTGEVVDAIHGFFW